MKEEFNLSEHLEEACLIWRTTTKKMIDIKDVKEALKILKERQCVCIDNEELRIKAKCRFCKDLKEIFGDKLI